MAKRINSKTFEEKIAEFNQIVNELDDSSIPFEEIAAKYESGIKLGAELENILNTTEQKILELDKNYLDNNDDEEQ